MSRKPCTHYVIYRNYSGKRWEVYDVISPRSYTNYFKRFASGYSTIQIRKITHI